MGGLTVYQAIKSTLPDANFYYCSDNEFHPYGTKADDAVAQRTLNVCSRFVVAAELDLLVIACNTASTVALGLLRSRLNLPIVGVVPAIKPAAEKSASGVIGLLATPATIKRIYVDEL
ncbi:MAG: glutamate racemase, partial [Proteobacteria bacterium]|nr:glutamate racemase [Pseudomonadota bacterium]